jgi:hypothetical protein
VIENVIDVTVIFVIFVIFVRLGETTVTLSASTAKGPFSTSTKINFDETVSGDFICKLAAKSMIKDLEQGRSYLHDDKGMPIKGKIVLSLSLSLSLSLLSS